MHPDGVIGRKDMFFNIGRKHVWNGVTIVHCAQEQH
jgi:hypothetical protein